MKKVKQAILATGRTCCVPGTDGIGSHLLWDGGDKGNRREDSVAKELPRPVLELGGQHCGVLPSCCLELGSPA